ncbi:hypothetical protein UAJ10_08775 [Nitrospirillum sp. BR 11164]|uniref:hypothetical protein n=1 Tax=Nitrospirillum sp. BR 11164 TaxID=3104324 RepID=UPI002AFE51B4|nr:hypothetical protein [Nitrospirillum sp. BR 11164]MEA1649112.1 hypothetical protein [Nitrospirillum sp. BR 11164]
MNELYRHANLRQPSPGYLYSLALAGVGLAFLSVGLGGTLAILKHADVLAVYGSVTPFVFTFALSLGFLYRLIFSARVSASLQALVRQFITLIFILEVIGAVVALVLFYVQWSVSPPPDDGDRAIVSIFMVFTCLCQIPTVIWLLRYRKE